MTPLVLIIAGFVALGVGAAVLRQYGPRYRVGRLLAATPTVTIAEARSIASGPPRYVAVRGRIDAEQEFEDDAHRPLVLRRTRLQVRAGDGWTTVDEQVEAVDFDVVEGLDHIAVEHGALDHGLIVVPRESAGTAAMTPDRVPLGTPADAPVRLRVEQVSSVEHAIVLGVPVSDPAVPDEVRLGPGLGRPLILTTLERDEAMRVLTEGRTGRPLAAALALGSGFVLVTLGLAWAVLSAVTGTAVAASPSPTAGMGGDPRSSGQGPGLVGDPLMAIGLVVAIALVAVVLTSVYIRLTGGRRGGM
ncbi:MAG: hypothetical protein WEC14_10985 [Chloroflexota bacterium]